MLIFSGMSVTLFTLQIIWDEKSERASQSTWPELKLLFFSDDDDDDDVSSPSR